MVLIGRGWKAGGELTRGRVLNRADDAVLVEVLLSDQLENRETDVFHVFCQVDGQLLPRLKSLAAEPARFVLRQLAPGGTGGPP